MISVLMPVYNNSSYLRQSIESILNQTYRDFEFIILDDGSTEAVAEIVNEFDDPRIIFLKNEQNIGLTKSLNISLDLAKGDYIARHDSDDISMPTRFEEQMKLFTDGVGLVSCYGYRFTENGRVSPDDYLDNKIKISNAEIKANIKNENCILGAGSIYSRAVFEKIGYYDDALYIAQDYIYWIRILTYFDVSIARSELYAIRKHQKSVHTVHHDRLKGIDFNALCKERALTHTQILSRKNIA
jgi:glycosyltransferase involved in cell wall biosynthesis